MHKPDLPPMKRVVREEARTWAIILMGLIAFGVTFGFGKSEDEVREAINAAARSNHTLTTHDRSE